MPDGSIHSPMSKDFMKFINEETYKDDVMCLGGGIWYIKREECIISFGDLAIIYLGYHDRLCKWVAIKRCMRSKDMSNDVTITKHLITHTSVVGFFDVLQDSDFVYIIMELYEVTVQKFIEKHENLPFNKKMGLALDLLIGLKYLHERGVVHRDLKPSNLMMTLTGNLKLVDFGISRNIGINSKTSHYTDVKGTLLWSSPETLDKIGEQLSVKKETDVYSMLMLLFYIFSGGRHPFWDLKKELGIISLHRAMTEARYQSKIEDPFLQEMFEKFMVKDPKKRPSVAKIIEYLDKTHRIKDLVGNRISCQILKRSGGKRYAILISSPTDLATASADVTCLRDALNSCSFKVIARNGITRDQLLSDMSDLNGHVGESIAEPLLELKQIVSQEATEYDDICIFMHVSARSYYNQRAEDFFLQFGNEKVSVKEIVQQIRVTFVKLNRWKVRLIFTTEACGIDNSSSFTQSIPFPSFPALLFYSVSEGERTSNSQGSLEGDFKPSPFVEALAASIKPALSLEFVIKNVINITPERSAEPYGKPVVDDQSGKPSLLEFVF